MWKGDSSTDTHWIFFFFSVSVVVPVWRSFTSLLLRYFNEKRLVGGNLFCRLAVIVYPSPHMSYGSVGSRANTLHAILFRRSVQLCFEVTHQLSSPPPFVRLHCPCSAFLSAFNRSRDSNPLRSAREAYEVSHWCRQCEEVIPRRHTFGNCPPRCRGTHNLWDVEIWIYSFSCLRLLCCHVLPFLFLLFLQRGFQFRLVSVHVSCVMWPRLDPLRISLSATSI